MTEDIKKAADKLYPIPTGWEDSSIEKGLMAIGQDAFEKGATSPEAEAYWRDRIEGEAVKFLIWVRENQFRVTAANHPKLKGKWFSDKIDAGYKTNSELFDLFRDQSK